MLGSVVIVRDRDTLDGKSRKDFHSLRDTFASQQLVERKSSALSINMLAHGDSHRSEQPYSATAGNTTRKPKKVKVKRAIVHSQSQTKLKEGKTRGLVSTTSKFADKSQRASKLKKRSDSRPGDLVGTYLSKLDRQHVLAAKERITLQKLVDKVTSGKQADFSQMDKKTTDKEAFFRQATKDGQPIEKDPVKTSQKIFGGELPKKANLDPAIKALVGKEVLDPNKEISFEERINRMFTKLATNAVQHKNNFKNTNYDLDRKMTRFMKERKERIQHETEMKKAKEERIAIADSSEDEDLDSQERMQKVQEIVIECERRLKKLFLRFPAGKTHYDQECMDLCIPFEEPVSKAKYVEITSDSTKVDQIAAILVRYNNLDPRIMEELCFVIPKIDPFDFKKYRDGQVELRKLRSQILGINPDFIVNMDDIDARVVEYQRDLELKNLSKLPLRTAQRSNSKPQGHISNPKIRLNEQASHTTGPKSHLYKQSKTLNPIYAEHQFTSMSQFLHSPGKYSGFKMSRVKSEIQSSSIDQRFLDSLDQSLHPRLLILALNQAKQEMAIPKKSNSLSQHQQQQLQVPNSKYRSGSISSKNKFVAGHDESASRLVEKPGQDQTNTSGHRMLAFEKLNSVLMIPEDITAKKLFYMQMQELENLFELKTKNKAIQREQERAKTNMRSQQTSHPLKMAQAFRTEQVLSSLSLRANQQSNENGKLSALQEKNSQDPEKQARLLAQQRKIDRQVAIEEAQRQAKLQQKAEDQFHKRLILSDTHNLVCDEFKEKHLNLIQSTQTNQSNSYNKLIQEPILRLNQFGYKPKKVRPREFIAQANKKIKEKSRKHLFDTAEKLSATKSSKILHTHSSMMTPGSRVDTLMSPPSKIVQSTAVMRVDLKSRCLYDANNFQEATGMAHTAKPHNHQQHPQSMFQSGIQTLQNRSPDGRLKNLSADRRKDGSNGLGSSAHFARSRAESPQAAKTRINAVTSESVDANSNEVMSTEDQLLCNRYQSQMNQHETMSINFGETVKRHSSPQAQANSASHKFELDMIQRQLDELAAKNEKSRKSMATLKEAVEKEIKAASRTELQQDSMQQQMSDNYQLQENFHPNQLTAQTKPATANDSTAKKYPSVKQGTTYKREIMSAKALPQRVAPKFAMRPQSGVPLSSKKVVPKNQEKSVQNETSNFKPLKTDGFHSKTYNNQQFSATNIDERSTQLSQPGTLHASAHFATRKVSIKERLFSAKASNQAKQGLNSTGQKKTDDRKQNSLSSHIDVSDRGFARLTSFAENWGIPIMRQSSDNFVQQPLLLHSQHQFMFQTRQMETNTDLVPSRNLWNQNGADHQKIVEEITMEAQENTVLQLSKTPTSGQANTSLMPAPSAPPVLGKKTRSFTRSQLPQSTNFSNGTTSAQNVQSVVSPLRPTSDHFKKTTSFNAQNTVATLFQGTTLASAAAQQSGRQTNTQTHFQKDLNANNHHHAISSEMTMAAGSGISLQANNAHAMKLLGLKEASSKIIQKSSMLFGNNSSSRFKGKSHKAHGSQQAQKNDKRLEKVAAQQPSARKILSNDQDFSTARLDSQREFYPSRSSNRGATTPAWEDALGVLRTLQSSHQQQPDLDTTPILHIAGKDKDDSTPSELFFTKTKQIKNNQVETIKHLAKSNYIEKITEQASSSSRQFLKQPPHKLLFTKIDESSTGTVEKSASVEKEDGQKAGFLNGQI